MYFYPTITDSLMEEAGFTAAEYIFSYSLDGTEKKLISKGKSTIKLEDPFEAWKLENDGVRLKRKISFEFPEELYGKNGVVCTGAELGVCIIWINRTLTQMGTILPSNEYVEDSIKYYEFNHYFPGGTIKGDLELRLQAYIKKASDNVSSDEEHLMNEEGVTVGTFDITRVDFGSIYMEFPIKEDSKKNQPLWWLETSTWTDPRVDSFNEDNVKIYLNTAYESCPKLGDVIKHEDVLIDIIATAYTMLFNRVDELDLLKDTRDDINLEPGSICKMLHYFEDSCVVDLDFSSEERLHKSIWINVASMIKGENNSDSE